MRKSWQLNRNQKTDIGDVQQRRLLKNHEAH